MCTSTKVDETEEEDVEYLRNPFLDGLQLGETKGRDSLRVDADTAATTTTDTASAPGVVTPSSTTTTTKSTKSSASGGSSSRNALKV